MERRSEGVVKNNIMIIITPRVEKKSIKREYKGWISPEKRPREILGDPYIISNHMS